MANNKHRRSDKTVWAYAYQILPPQSADREINHRVAAEVVLLQAALLITKPLAVADDSSLPSSSLPTAGLD